MSDQIREGNLIIDSETGEVLMDVSFPPERIVDSAPDVDALLWRRQRIEFAMAGMEAQKQAIVAQMSAMIAAEQKKLAYYDRWNEDLRRYGEQHRGSAKTIKTPHGSLVFRKVPSRLIVRDGMDAAAILWAKAMLPDAVKVTESLLISVVAKSPGQHHLALAGLFAMTEEIESFRIDTGKP
jgi:hypothetical protein